MARFENTDVHTRIWHNLINAETLVTLELAPGEDAEVVVPSDFDDTYLKPVKAKRRGPEDKVVEQHPSEPEGKPDTKADEAATEEL